MRRRSLLESYGPETEYITDPKDSVADTLSRLPKQGDIDEDVGVGFPFRSVGKDLFLVQLKFIQGKQTKDRELRQRVRNNSSRFQ